MRKQSSLLPSSLHEPTDRERIAYCCSLALKAESSNDFSNYEMLYSLLNEVQNPPSYVTTALSLLHRGEIKGVGPCLLPHVSLFHAPRDYKNDFIIGNELVYNLITYAMHCEEEKVYHQCLSLAYTILHTLSTPELAPLTSSFNHHYHQNEARLKTLLKGHKLSRETTLATLALIQESL